MESRGTAALSTQRFESSAFPHPKESALGSPSSCSLTRENKLVGSWKSSSEEEMEGWFQRPGWSRLDYMTPSFHLLRKRRNGNCSFDFPLNNIFAQRVVGGVYIRVRGCVRDRVE